jgi:hypothetical protein
MGLFLSRDQGATWEAFGAGDNGIPFSLFSNPFYPGSANAQIVFDPSNARHLFLLHNFGVNEAWDPGPGGGL